jgi:lipoprotein-releasing system ATP-binding protein
MLKVEAVSKEFETAGGVLPILRGVSFSKGPGEALCIMGPSGSGKSTLLHILGTLEPPTSGKVTFDERDPFQLRERELSAFRNREIGFVFQEHFLLPQCSVLENVLTPTLVSGADGPHEARARELLGRVGLGERLDHRPAELSGGERQRAALARALVLGPRLILCDEPTGNLDADSAQAVADLLLDLHATDQATLIVVTHSAALAERFADRRLLTQGRLEAR